MEGLTEQRQDRRKTGQEEKGAETEDPEEFMLIETRGFLHPNTKILYLQSNPKFLV